MTIDGVDGANGKDGTDGLDIVWKGDLSAPPANPVKNWVYRDIDNGRVYIYNGTAWALMVADGNDGATGAAGSDGLSVYITYHDSESQPAVPTGMVRRTDGTLMRRMQSYGCLRRLLQVRLPVAGEIQLR